MDKQGFIKKLNDAQELMKNEQYEEAVIILDKLREIEKKEEDFDYSLTHKLYQLDSNCHSLLNQQIILEHINTLSKNLKLISFHDLSEYLKNNGFKIDASVLGKEVELLKLRGLVPCKIEGGNIIF